MRIGLFFGSFNPIHIGHLIIANHMAEFTDLEEVWFVVTPHNPFKVKSTLLADHHRFRLVSETTDDYDKLKPSNIEFGLSQPNYTIHTLVHLAERHPEHRFNLIMGLDNLQSFPKWKNSNKIIHDFGLIVYPRPGSVEFEKTDHPNITYIEAPLLDISATYIRKCIREDKSIQCLVPEKTAEFIKDRKLYV